MRLLRQEGRFVQLKRRGGAPLRFLVILAVAGIGWLCWRTTRSHSTGAPPSRPLQVSAGNAALPPPSPPAPVPAPATASAPVPATATASSPSPTSPPTSPLILPRPEADGRLIIPASARSGRSEPIVLVPVSVSARSAPTSVPVPLPGPVPDLPATNAVVAPAFVKPPFDEQVLKIQAALCRHGVSPGSLDGLMGSQTRAALCAWQQREGLPINGATNQATLAKLDLDAPLYDNYTVTDADLADLQPLGKTWLEKSQQTSLAFETVLERLAERCHCNPKLVRWLNPSVDWEKITAGTSVRLVQAEYPAVEQRAAFVRIFLAERKLQAYDANSNLLVHFPCSIAARVEKRPLGEELHIIAIAPNPNYTFDPAVFPESEEARELGRKLLLAPGPNNPVGTVWLSLDKPGYGIHGTPKPEDVGRTESHGCFRLANWNAEYLLKLVSVGVPVSIEP